MSPELDSRRPITRRQFLKSGCITVAAVGLTLTGVGLAIPEPPPIELASFTFGEGKMNKRILVAYATHCGSTMEVATEIGKTLNTQEVAVDVKPMQDNPTWENYQAVVLGSAIQYGQWLPEAADFIKSNQQALNQRPVALFCVHIQNLGDDQASQQNRRAYLDQVRRLLRPVAEGYFAGKFDRRGAPLMLPKLLARLVPTLDFRKWDKIRAWAEDISPLLQPASG